MRETNRIKQTLVDAVAVWESEGGSPGPKDDDRPIEPGQFRNADPNPRRRLGLPPTPRSRKALDHCTDS